MPSDDVILNLKQIAGYTSAPSPLPSDALVVQRGGLGGPYMSILANEFVGDVLATPAAGPISVGVQAPTNATGAQVFTNAIVGSFGQRFWNAYIASGSGGTTQSVVYLQTGLPAAMNQCDPSLGWCWEWAPPGTAGQPVDLTTAMTISPTGYLEVADQVLLARDPQAPLEAATAQWVTASTVTSFNGRKGAVQLWLQDILKAGGAPIYSPFFMGSPRSFTPSLKSNSTRLATTQFAHAAAQNAVNCFAQTQPLVFSVNGRSGDVVISTADIDAALAGSPSAFAPLYSPQFSGYPTAPTPPLGTATGEIATTAFVMNAVSASTAGVASFNGRTGLVTLENTDIAGAGGALLLSPAFAGVPTAPTGVPGDASTQIATDAFVAAAISSLAFAPLNSPAFTGTPTAPTPAPATSATQQVATAAFVQQAIAAATLVSTFNNRSGAVTLIPADISAAGGLVNPSVNLTGSPTATTPTAGDSSTRIATTAFVAGAIAAGVSGYLPLSGGTLTGQLNTTGVSASGTIAAPLLATTGAGSAQIGTGGLTVNADVTCSGVSCSTVTSVVTLGSTALVAGASGPAGVANVTLQNYNVYANAGTVYCVQVIQSSDRGRKTDIGPFGSTPAIDAVNSIPVHQFHWRTDPGSAPMRFGWVWDEVRDAFPRTSIPVEDEERDYRGLDTCQMLAVLWQAVRELSAKVATLEARLA